MLDGWIDIHDHFPQASIEFLVTSWLLFCLAFLGLTCFPLLSDSDGSEKTLPKWRQKGALIKINFHFPLQAVVFYFQLSCGFIHFSRNSSRCLETPSWGWAGKIDFKWPFWEGAPTLLAFLLCNLLFKNEKALECSQVLNIFKKDPSCKCFEVELEDFIFPANCSRNQYHY